ncbi:cell division cycle-associated protein 3 [Aulostomus maculatus]
MGSSESKPVVPAPAKPEPAIKNSRVADLVDPRSPSAGISRTPIQVGGPIAKASVQMKGECPLVFSDPRSPTIGIVRTPVREVMRAVGSFARRLGLFHHEVEGKVLQKHPSDAVEEEEGLKHEELDSTEPLLTPTKTQTFGSLAEHATLLTTAIQPPLQSIGDSSPFVLLEEPQVEVEIETEAEFTLEEAEEAKESPLHKRLSMSLLTCHEGATPSQVFAEVHIDSASSPVPCVDAEPLGDGEDHAYAFPSITVEPSTPDEPPLAANDLPVPTPPVQPEEAELPASPAASNEPVEEAPVPPASAPSEPPTIPSPDKPQQHTGIHCLTFNAKSPSQVVFKPQWLGKGFGAPGLRARAVQGPSGKRGSSPLAVSVAVKNVSNENKGLSGKLKEKGTEGRSPLQILKETNSPRGRSQRTKASSSDKPRLGQMDGRVLAVALDKENR